MSSKFRIFGGFEWVLSLILVDKRGFGRVRCVFFPDLGLGLACSWRNSFEVCLGLLEGYERVRYSVLVDKPVFE